MKRVFLSAMLATFMFAADAETTSNGAGGDAAPDDKQPEPKPEPTSEKLDELKKQYVAAMQTVVATAAEPFSKAAIDAKTALWKLDGEMKAEILAIKKAEADAAAAEARNQRLQLNATQLDAYKAMLDVNADANATAEAKQAATDAFTTAREAVENELLARFAGSKPAKASLVVGDGTTSKNGTEAAAIVELYLAGKTNKEIIEAGYPRSTVWHAINNYKKANEAAK